MSTISSSSGTTSISGIISGMDTASVISQLMQVEAAPQTMLKTKQATTSSLVTAMQSLNTKVASLTTAAKTAASATSWKAVQATSSAESVSAVADSRATTASVSFTVEAVAKPQSSLVTIPSSFYSYPPTFTITRANGETVQVTAASTAMSDIVEAFNGVGTGVRASLVTANGSSYMQLTGDETGTENAFTVSTQDSTGTLQNLTSMSISTASDASITLFAGTAAAQTLTQSSNTFSDVVRGVDFTVSAVETDPVTIDVARDDTAITALAKNLVSGLNTALSEISSRTAAQTVTRSDGTTYTKGGLFSGNSSIRALQQDLLGASASSAGGTSLKAIGIELTADGQYSIDEEAFGNALKAGADTVQQVLTSMASTVQSVGDHASNSGYGSLTLEVQSQQSIAKDLSTRISGWDDRLAARQASLEKIYSAMEVSLSNLQSQSNWLTSQISSLTSSTK